MNNRYLIRVYLCGYKYRPQIITTQWYNNPDYLIRNMDKQLTDTIYELSEKRGRYMRKLERKGVEWFKRKVHDNIFHCCIDVIKFNNSFDNSKEFDDWIASNGIIIDKDTMEYLLPGDINNRKRLQEYAIDYYIDRYDCDLNKIDSLSCVYLESEPHRRLCIDPKFKPGDVLSYDKCGNYKVVGYPQKYNSLYWHDGYINVYDIDHDDMEYIFDWPELLEMR